MGVSLRMNSDKIITISNLSKSYKGGFKALKDANLEFILKKSFNDL